METSVFVKIASAVFIAYSRSGYKSGSPAQDKKTLQQVSPRIRNAFFQMLFWKGTVRFLGIIKVCTIDTAVIAPCVKIKPGFE